MSETKFEELVVEALYDAAADPRRIDTALERLVTYSRSHGAAIFIGGSTPDEPVQGVWNWGFPEDAESTYLDGYVEHDLSRARVFAHEADRWHDAVAFASPEEIKRNPYYQEFLPKIGTRSIAGARIRYRDGQMMMSLHRGPRSNDFSPADLKRLDRLTPHLKRFARLRRLIPQADRSNLLEEVVRHLQAAILVIDQRERIDFISAAAERLLEDADGILVRDSRLTILDGDAHHRFRYTLAAALTSARASAEGAADLSIPRPSGRRSYYLTIMPIGQSSIYAGRTGAPKAMIVITDPEGSSNVSPERLISLFGLTRAEARLAEALQSGLALEEIADMFKVARSTLRSQLLATFAKTGTSRQSELMRLLMKIHPDPL